MEARYINAVYRATNNIFKDALSLSVAMETPYAGVVAVDSKQVSVILGVTGELEGQIICSFDMETAQKIVGLMMGGIEVEELDEIGWSALCEFGNWVAGHAATEIESEGTIVDITPPVTSEGHSKFRTNTVFVSVPMASEIGLLEVHVSLEKE